MSYFAWGAVQRHCRFESVGAVPVVWVRALVHAEVVRKNGSAIYKLLNIFVLRSLVYRQHEQSLQLESRIVGGAVQVACEFHGTVVVAGASPVIVVCLTKTGIAAPVASLKTRWPSTGYMLASIRLHERQDLPRSRLLISPEWLVIEM